MNINRRHLRVAASASAIALLLQVAPVGAQGNPDLSRPVEISFTKWGTGVVPATGLLGVVEGRSLLQGVTGGDLPNGTFVGEVLQRQLGANPALKTGIIKLEAIYEFHDVNGNHVFTALIRGGINVATGVGLLDGLVLAGWRTGAAVRAQFQTIPGTTGCVGAPSGVTCFEGAVHVGRAPKNDQ